MEELLVPGRLYYMKTDYDTFDQASPGTEIIGVYSAHWAKKEPKANVFEFLACTYPKPSSWEYSCTLQAGVKKPYDLRELSVADLPLYMWMSNKTTLLTDYLTGVKVGV